MKRITILLLSFIVISCASPVKDNPTRHFPTCEIPSMVTQRDERMSFYARHYWDKFFTEADGFSTDTTMIAGVRCDEFEKVYADYVQLLSSISVEVALKSQDSLIAKASRDTAIYSRILKLSDRYLFDPNSPFRNEEYYIPVLESILVNPCSEGEKMRAEGLLPRCSLNRLGTVAADFSYTLKSGKKGRMHDIKSEYLLLFFSNPGCHNCKEIIEQLSSVKEIGRMIDKGTLTVLNVYPDEDLKEWYSYLPNYPSQWITAYDPVQALNSGEIYHLRAIPSLYLLDSNKRVIFKDAPLEVILDRLVWSGSQD